ncbi:MAG: M20 family metallopeptidase, partial [Planctomycetales bacterium]|jgi:succinyl-diaminopimelate desuccinylase
MPDSVVELLRNLVAIPSVNPMGRDLSGPIYFEAKVTEYLGNFFAELGCPHEVIEVTPGRCNVLAKFESPNATQTFLLDAHQDTVPVDGMTIPPFEPTIKDGRIYGRGSSDVKGGMAAMLWAFRRLVLEKPAGAANVIMSCTCDEEATTTGINDLVRYWQDNDGRSKFLSQKPDAAIVAEPTLLDVVVAHRGVSRFVISTGGRACHSSDPTQGVNAIYRMARLVSCLEDYAADLPGRSPAHPLCGPATLSVGLISGGASVNVVPDECSIEVDRRLTPGDNADEAYDDIRNFLTSKLDFEFDMQPPYIVSPTLSNDDNGWLADGLQQHISEVAGPHTSVGVPYGTHASRTCSAGVPSVVFGPGSIDQAHTKDEWLEIDQLEKASEVYFRFCSNPPPTPSN